MHLTKNLIKDFYFCNATQTQKHTPKNSTTQSVTHFVCKYYKDRTEGCGKGYVPPLVTINPEDIIVMKGTIKVHTKL